MAKGLAKLRKLAYAVAFREKRRGFLQNVQYVKHFTRKNVLYAEHFNVISPIFMLKCSMC